MRVRKVPIAFFSNKLKKGEVFSFSRYGDGEWNAILGVKGTNCDGHTYFKELGRDLRRAITNPLPYYYGLQNMTIRRMLNRIRPILKKDYDYKWLNSDVFHYASWHGRFRPIVKALRQKKVCLVGPKYLDCPKLNFLTTGGHIVIPRKDCYRNKIKIEHAIIKRAKPGMVFSLCASMLSEVIIHDLFNMVGHVCWLIDFGSVWDPYAGRPTRRYHKCVTPHIQKINLQS